VIVRQFKNEPFKSNTYLISNEEQGFIIIDPDLSSVNDLNHTIRNENLPLLAVILTHEHFDHCSGVDELVPEKEFGLICSTECKNRIRNAKTNLSLYFDVIEPFEIKRPAFEIKEDVSMTLAGLRCNFVLTPGHSPGSMCILTEDALFSGDTLLNDLKVPLSLPGSNKNDFSASIEKLQNILMNNMTIYPGHGNAYLYQKEAIK
jgi:hydroxyacylglutathione hydrolase